jgi:HEAT repeat protein
LVDFIEHGSAARREAALDATRYLNQELISALAEVAATNDYERRWAAYQAIKRIGGEAAITPLVEALRSDDLSARWIASDGLTTIGQPAAIEVLRALSITEPTINFHRAARRVLRHLEVPGHDPALQRLLASLEHATALTLAPALAQELLRELEREFPT